MQETHSSSSMERSDHPLDSSARNGLLAERLDADQLKGWCLEAGADDVGFVDVERPALKDEASHIRRHAPRTRSLISFVCRMNREPIRNPARSVANLEFHHAGHDVDEVARRIVRMLERRGIRAINPAMGFPMEMDEFPGRLWVVSHKPVAVEAGLGRMGIHRNVIHPKFGNFILLGTVLVEAEISGYTRPIDYNPCLECKLCVSACPVGAIAPDGSFNFSSCYTHNYREFMGGFTDLMETAASARNRGEFQDRFTGSETVSFWQSLSFGANYKAAYCMAACPAGEDVIGQFVTHKPTFIKETVKPLQQKVEPVYVIKGSDAEAHVRRRFPHKLVRHTPNTLRPERLDQFIDGMHLAFQPGQSEGLNATYHFEFTGEKAREVTVDIRDQKIEVRDGFVGQADIRVVADSKTWVRFLRQEVSIVSALLRFKVRLRGNPKLLIKFGKCFPN